mgnify:FL=1
MQKNDRQKKVMTGKLIRKYTNEKSLKVYLIKEGDVEETSLTAWYKTDSSPRGLDPTHFDGHPIGSVWMLQYTESATLDRSGNPYLNITGAKFVRGPDAAADDKPSSKPSGSPQSRDSVGLSITRLAALKIASWQTVPLMEDLWDDKDNPQDLNRIAQLTARLADYYVEYADTGKIEPSPGDEKKPTNTTEEMEF